MGYYLQIDLKTYDGEFKKVATCTGISEAIVLKILDSINISSYEIKIYKEVNDELQDN